MADDAALRVLEHASSAVLDALTLDLMLPGDSPARTAAPVEHPAKEPTLKVVTPMPTNPSNSTVLGRSVAFHGELTANEDLLIEGQFDGTIHLEDHSVTVGAGGEVKAEIHARQVIIYGKVNGNISAREKVDIRKTGHVLGDLTTAGVAIEDGAYFKGSIDIVKSEPSKSPAQQQQPRPQNASTPATGHTQTAAAGAEDAGDLAAGQEVELQLAH